MKAPRLRLRQWDTLAPDLIEAEVTATGFTLTIENPLVQPERHGGARASITLDETAARALHHLLTDLLLMPKRTGSGGGLTNAQALPQAGSLTSSS